MCWTILLSLLQTKNRSVLPRVTFRAKEDPLGNILPINLWGSWGHSPIAPSNVWQGSSSCPLLLVIRAEHSPICSKQEKVGWVSPYIDSTIPYLQS